MVKKDVKLKRVLLSAVPLNASNHDINTMVRMAREYPKTGIALESTETETVLQRYDTLYKNILRNTIYKNLTDNEVDNLASVFDQHVALFNLGGHLMNKNFFVKLSINDWRRPVDDFIKRRIQDIDTHNIDLIGMTMATPDFPTVQQVANELKKARPNLIVVVGGSHPTFLPERVLYETPGIDIAIMGPGDYALIQIVSNVPLEQIAGIAYKIDEQIKVNPRDKSAESFLGFSYPFDYNKALHPARKFPLARIFSKIGCSQKCYYCADAVWHGQSYGTDIVKLNKEITNLYNLRDTRYFYLHDHDALNQIDHFRQVVSIFSKLKNKDERVRYSIQTTSHSILKTSEVDLIETNNSGANWVQLGLESIEPTINSKTNIKQFDKAIHKIKKCMPNAFVTIYILIGLPGDSYKKSKDTMKYYESLSKQDLAIAPCVTLFIPYPATKVYQYPDKYKITIDDSDWRKFAFIKSAPPYHYKHMSSKDILKCYQDMVVYASNIMEDKVSKLEIDEKSTMSFYKVI